MAEMGWKDVDPLVLLPDELVRLTVIEAVTFADAGIHFVETAPSTAEIGNWPGTKSPVLAVMGWHCARLPGTVLLKPARRLGTIRPPLAGRVYMVELSVPPSWTGIEMLA